MAHESKINQKGAVLTPKRSGFDMSHENLFTATCGTLVPCLTELLVPGEQVSLGSLMQVELPPMATQFFGRIDACLEAFFVPCRLLYGGFNSFINRIKSLKPDMYGGSQPMNSNIDETFLESINATLPFIQVSASDVANYFGRGTLADYLGERVKVTLEVGETYRVSNILPYLSYHKIYESYYRNPNIEKPCFVHPTSSVASTIYTLPFERISSSASPIIGNSALYDGVPIFALRQRNFAKDLFTTATVHPNTDTSSELKVDTSSGGFTIPQLRAANTLQQFLERAQVAGWRDRDLIRARFGVTPPSLCDTPIYLGRVKQQVYCKSVYSDALPAGNASSRNPFYSSTEKGSPAAKFGSASASGEGSLVGSFEAKEHGYLMVLFSLVPHAYYATGRRKHLTYSQACDFPEPMFESIGQRPISSSELIGTNDSATTFGYADPYYEAKYHEDEVHGLLADGEALSSFALQRSFGGNPVINKNFIQIPTNFLDQIFAVNEATSGFSCWVDLYLPFKKSSPLSDFIIPTLGKPENMRTKVVDKRGQIL